MYFVTDDDESVPLFYGIDWSWVVGIIALLLVFGCIGMALFTPEMFLQIPLIKTTVELNEKREQILDGFNFIAKNSQDCKELQQVQLDLISHGVNPDSWFPKYSDRIMKIAQERYDVLC